MPPEGAGTGAVVDVVDTEAAPEAEAVETVVPGVAASTTKRIQMYAGTQETVGLADDKTALTTTVLVIPPPPPVAMVGAWVTKTQVSLLVRIFRTHHFPGRGSDQAE